MFMRGLVGGSAGARRGRLRGIAAAGAAVCPVARGADDSSWDAFFASQVADNSGHHLRLQGQ
jgi:hypothetical protein